MRIFRTIACCYSATVIALACGTPIALAQGAPADPPALESPPKSPVADQPSEPAAPAAPTAPTAPNAPAEPAAPDAAKDPKEPDSVPAQLRAASQELMTVEAEAEAAANAPLPVGETDVPASMHAVAQQHIAQQEEDDFPQEPLPKGTEAREAPDYDGRGEDPGTSDALIVPRILFSPLYLVSEFVIRRPLGALVTAAEEDNWLAVLGDFFTFDEENKVGLVPTAYLEFDFEPSVGVYFFADDAFTDDNDLRVSAAMWPADWWKLTLLDRYSNRTDTRFVGLRGNITVRPDYQFHGLGPESRDQDEARYQSTTFETSALFHSEPWRASLIELELGVRDRRFGADSDFDTPNLEEAIADPANQISALPPGFGGYSIYRQRIKLAVDTRLPFPAPGHGVRLEGRGEQAFDLGDAVARRWVRYGGTAGAFVDISHHRIVSLALDLEFVDPSAGQVPFSELATIGGAPPMHGFQEGRLYGRSSAVALLEYRWPIWIWMDFALHYSVGNVFGEHLDGFEFDLLRSSFGLGLRSARSSKPDHSLNFIIAVGTEPFKDGSSVDTVRFAVGGTSGI